MWKHLAIARLNYQDLILVQEGEEEDLFYPVHEDDIHVDVYDEDPQPLVALLGDHVDASRSLPWSGTYTLRQFDGDLLTHSPAGVINFTLPGCGETSGPVTGTGMDGAGDFTIIGRILGSSIVFNQRHVSTAVEMRRWQGGINEEHNKIEGSWGPIGTLGDNFDALLEDSDVTGHFELQVVPIRFSFLEPSSAELVSNRPRALWQFAIKTVLNVLKIGAGNVSWAYLQNRRLIRKRFLELYSRLDDEYFSWIPYSSRAPLSATEADELARHAAMCTKSDLQFYRKLCMAFQRRRVFHW